MAWKQNDRSRKERKEAGKHSRSKDFTWAECCKCNKVYSPEESNEYLCPLCMDEVPIPGEELRLTHKEKVAIINGSWRIKA